MITNFEQLTAELSEDELLIIPVLITGFKNHTKKNPIKSDAIVKEMNKYLVQNNFKIKMTGVRLRKCCNYIRTNSIIPLIATSDGYYTSYEENDIELEINSLVERANSIMRSAAGLTYFKSRL
jgi:hypothetical protein